MTMKQTFRERFYVARRFLTNRPKGFYVPYEFWQSLPEQVETYPAVEDFFKAREDGFLERLTSFTGLIPDLKAQIDRGGIPWGKPGKFPQGDMALAYLLLRQERPSRVLEIGSGTSTHVIASALEDNGTGSMICIDPSPRREIESRGVEFHRRYLRNDDTALVEAFSPGDVLFVDSSHLFQPGGDVDIEFNRLFPALPKGTLVHVHDIFLPDGYPLSWFRKRFAEQNALIGWILSGYFDVVFPAYYMFTRHEDAMRAVLGDLFPSDPESRGGSMWLRKT